MNANSWGPHFRGPFWVRKMDFKFGPLLRCARWLLLRQVADGSAAGVAQKCPIAPRAKCIWPAWAFANMRRHDHSVTQPRSNSLHVQELSPKLRGRQAAPIRSSCLKCAPCVRRRTNSAPAMTTCEGSGEAHGLRAEPTSQRRCVHKLRACPAKLQRAPLFPRGACLLRLISECRHHHHAWAASHACVGKGLCPADENL